ncbi:hypothetical protein LTR66_014951, partial [Elasticomyces elasticus]
MVNINVAYTAAINPPGVTPVLTVPQLWVGLQRKVRDAPAFVSAILACEVLEDKDGEVLREVQFDKKSGKGGPDGKVQERCIMFEPMKVDFHQPDGSLISNIISEGPSQQPDDLWMTYAFEWKHPAVEAGTEKYDATLANDR